MKTFLRTFLAILFVLAGLTLILGAAVFSAHSALGNYLSANPVYIQAAPALLSLAMLEPSSASKSSPPANQPVVVKDLSTQEVNNLAHTLSSALTNSSGSGSIQSAPTQASPTPFKPTAPITPTVTVLESPPLATLQPETVEGVLSDLPPKLFPPTPTPQPGSGDAFFTYPSYTETNPPNETPNLVDQPNNPAPVYTPSEPIVRISIPRLKIKRAVVEIGMVRNGQDWDTDSLFATRNRPDLVGHLEGSALPGEEGNTVLVGHNYDYNGAGVFVNLDNLRDGDEITLFTEGGQEFSYQVVKVKSVPYSGDQGIERHQRFLDPRGEERLTLVTCGGANIGFFNRRVYVVAYPLAP